MISAGFGRYLNTLFGFISNGTILCIPCGERDGVRERLRAGKPDGDELCLSGVDAYSTGDDFEDDMVCSDCGEDVDAADFTVRPHCKGATAQPKWTCEDCGDPLTEHAEVD